MRKALKIITTCFVAALVLFTGAFAIVNNTKAQEEQQTVTCALSSSKIKEIQTKLKNWGYYTGAVDGISGPKTVAAIKLFQKRNGLVADGIVGSKTAAAMGIKLTSSSSSSSSYSNDEYLLAKIIYAEARGESYTGQVAIGAVVLNRVKNSKFPNTISGVIYQPYAFTAVNDGQINLEPNSTAYKAAKDALSGWDPTYGSLYYFNPKTATSSWIWSRQQTVTIGNHIFCK